MLEIFAQLKTTSGDVALTLSQVEHQELKSLLIATSLHCSHWSSRAGIELQATKADSRLFRLMLYVTNKLSRQSLQPHAFPNCHQDSHRL